MRGTDNTAYARSLGYTGPHKVIVCNGRIVSMNNRMYQSFCDHLKKQQEACRNEQRQEAWF